ncbi:ABC transporter permease [Candidatus Saccharibacteria bacterium]|nr:ABC transporter permease [Candidatus Saccharibacteria bacterium]
MKICCTSAPAAKISILLSIAFRNLTSKKLRSSLTIFGISIGIGSIYFLLSFGIGLQALVTSQVIGNQSIKTIDVVTPNSKIITLDDITTERINEINNVASIGKAYYYPGGYKISNSESDAIIYGIDDGYESLTYLNLIAGSHLSESNKKDSVLLNTAALESVGLSNNAKDVIGTTLTLSVPLSKISDKTGLHTQDFVVVGIVDSGSGAEAFIDYSLFRSLGAPSLTQLKVGANQVEDVPKIRTQIESFGLETTSPVDTLTQINVIFQYFNLILVGFGAIGMFIAIIGMFNTLTISLLERTKEIGLMVALGARAIDMRILFMLEALLLSLVGTIFGLFGSFIVSNLVTAAMNMFAQGRGVQEGFALFAHPWWLLLGVFVFMIAVGFAVVYLPARRAERINPIDALRHE